jgi:hypothetical protein
LLPLSFSVSLASLVRDCQIFRQKKAALNDHLKAESLVRAKQVAVHYEQARQIAKELELVPISHRSTAIVAREAFSEGQELLPDGTVAALTIAKDIPWRDSGLNTSTVRSASENGNEPYPIASWSGEISGPAANNFRLAQDIAGGVIRDPDELVPDEIDQDVIYPDEIIEPEDEGAPLPLPPHPHYGRVFQDVGHPRHMWFYYGFVDFWAVCMRHRFVLVFHCIFIRQVVFTLHSQPLLKFISTQVSGHNSAESHECHL